MTDEDVSELGEFLWMCCATAKHTLRPLDRVGPTYCPLDAAFSYYGFAFERLGYNVCASIMRGFDGDTFRTTLDDRLFDLGRRFREQALSGEGFR